MNAHEAIENQLASSMWVVRELLSDLEDTDLLIRPVEGANHIAWQLGHLIRSEHEMIEAAAPGSMPALPEAFAENYTAERAASDDARNFTTKERYLALYAEQRDGTLRALRKMSAEELDATAPEAYVGFAPTVGKLLLLQGSHGIMHAGQFSVVRRKLGRRHVL